MNYSEKSLKSILADYGVERTQKVLSSFICDNDEVQDFINNKAISHEERGLAKTIIVFDDNKGLLVGFYTLSIKSLVLSDKLSSNKRKSYFGTAQTNGDVIPAILIGQLGKNNAVESDFTGSDLMSLIFGYIYKADKLLPSVVSYVEHNESKQLFKFYEKHGFSYFPRTKEEKEKKLFCHVIKTSDIVEIFEK
ncbi:MAG: hypothetical protein IKE92_09600 [Clostridiales bacterium]|nr:hypothetical protein [Clostridiales bacterium]